MKYRSTSGIACLCRFLFRASMPVTAVRASPVPDTSHTSRDESTCVNTNPAAAAAMTSNTTAIKRKRTSILLEPRTIVLLFRGGQKRQLREAADDHRRFLAVIAFRGSKYLLVRAGQADGECGAA
jgi:hypothetical protein